MKTILFMAFPTHLGCITKPSSVNFKRFWSYAVLISLIFSSALATQSAFAFMGAAVKLLGKVEHALPEEGIVKLTSQIAQSGISKVGQVLETAGLSRTALEDAYLRIAVNQSKLEKTEAEHMFHNLTGVDGFKETIRKVVGINANQTKGHLQELRIANHAKEQGLEVVSIGQKFDDGIKKQLTDMDVILKKDKNTFLIQSKHYESPSSYNPVKLQGDADSLLQYKQTSCNKDCIPVFFFTNEPPANVSALLTKTKPDVHLIVGDAESQVIQLKILAKELTK
jgi:hypothetical protein